MTTKSESMGPLTAYDQSARDAGCSCKRNMPYMDWSHAKECALYVAMSAESEVELPELDVTPDDIEHGEKYKLPDYLQPDDLQDVMKWWIKLFSWMGGAIESRERQLKAALRDKRAAEHRIEQLDRRITISCGRQESFKRRAQSAEAALAAANQRADEAFQIVNAARAVRIYGSDYKNGTHAKELWRLVDRFDQRPTGKAGE